jgi:hypothetical protein
MAIEAEREIVEAIAVVRESEKCNMADWRCVHAALLDDGQQRAAAWLEANVGVYFQGLYQGFEASD